MVSIKYILFDSYLSFESISIILRMFASTIPIQAIRSFEYLAAYFRLIIEASSTKVI